MAAKKTGSLVFYTTDDPEDCRIWLWCACDIESKEIYYGTNLATFFKLAGARKFGTFWAEDLKFSGHFIIDALLRAEYSWVVKDFTDINQFSTIMSSNNEMFLIKIHFSNGAACRILDKNKILPQANEKLAETYNVKYYGCDLMFSYRPKKYEPENFELESIAAHALLIAEAVKNNYNAGLKYITVAGNALGYYKKTIGGKSTFRKFFPLLPLSVDNEIRECYFGGINYLNPYWQGIETGKGITVDCNAMYSSVMLAELMPYGEPKHFDGRRVPDPEYPLYVQKMVCELELQKKGIPFLQEQDPHNKKFHQALIKTHEPIEICLTSVDLDLLYENYDVIVWEYIGGYMFKGMHGLFDNYINFWQDKKMSDSPAEKIIGKCMLNFLYGKFGTVPERTTQEPVMYENSIVWTAGEKTYTDPVYIPVAVFTTAYARRKLMLGIINNKKRFITCRTDSLHLTGWDMPAGVEISKEIGAWKIERKFSNAKYLRSNAYIYETEEGLGAKVSGMPENIKPALSFERFTYGFSNYDEEGNIIPGLENYEFAVVPGGMVRVPGIFTILPDHMDQGLVYTAPEKPERVDYFPAPEAFDPDLTYEDTVITPF